MQHPPQEQTKLQKTLNQSYVNEKLTLKRLIIALPVLLVASLVLFGVARCFAYLEGSDASALSEAAENAQAATANAFDKIQLQARVMPSQNTEGNFLVMEAKSEASPHEGDYDEEVADNISELSFVYNQTQAYFPTLRFDEQHTPVGSAKNYCLNLAWIQRSKRRLFDRYFQVQDLPACKSTKSLRVHWQESDPRNGLDFLIWKQQATEVNSEYDCQGNSVFVGAQNKGKHKCYSYQVLQSLCVLVEYVEDPDNNSYSWNYQGGCYENNEIGFYKPAEIGEVYTFDYLPIEVRESNGTLGSRFTNATGITLSSFFNSLGVLCLLAALIMGVFIAYAFYEAYSKQEQVYGHHRFEDGH